MPVRKWTRMRGWLRLEVWRKPRLAQAAGGVVMLSQEAHFGHPELEVFVVHLGGSGERWARTLLSWVCSYFTA